MSFVKGQAVTYIDHEGNQQGALVLVPDNANHEATIALVKRDASDPVLNSADFHDGLERKFNIDSTQDRIAKLADERQGVSDATGQAQPAVEYADLTETIYASPYTLPTGPFKPAAKPEEPAPPVSLVGGVSGTPTAEQKAATGAIPVATQAAAAGAEGTESAQPESTEPAKTE